MKHERCGSVWVSAAWEQAGVKPDARDCRLSLSSTWRRPASAGGP